MRYTDDEMKKMLDEASKHYANFLEALKFDWKSDPNMIDTPRRVAKSIVDDLCSSLYEEPPKITAFQNVDKYDGIVMQTNITVKSLCAHHFQNIFGIAHVAYLPDANGTIIGLSKLNRIVEYNSRKPQVQENLVMNIHDDVNQLCDGNHGVAVIIKAKHNCVSHRGINDTNSSMITSKLSGAFLDNDRVRNEFYELVKLAERK
jgi:GTP cyclohydrolase I